MLDSLFSSSIICDIEKFKNIKISIEKHQSHLLDNVFSLIQEKITEIVDKLSHDNYNWTDTHFKFLSPSVETCYLINYINQVTKNIEKFMMVKEFNDFFNSLSDLVNRVYIDKIEELIKISKHNVSGLNKEKAFIKQNLDEFKSDMLNKKMDNNPNKSEKKDIEPVNEPE